MTVRGRATRWRARYFLYYIGGPLDLSKVALPDRPPRYITHVEQLPAGFHDRPPGDVPSEVEVKTVIYRTHRWPPLVDDAEVFLAFPESEAR